VWGISVIPAKAGIHFSLRRSREGGNPVTCFRRCTLAEHSSLLGFVRLPGGRVTFFACTKKVTKEMHPRLRAGGEAAGSLRSAGVWRQGSCPVAKCGPSWPAPRAVHAALSGRPSPLHRGVNVKSNEAKASAAGTAALCSSRVPSRSRRAGGGKARRVAGRMPASLRPVHGRTVRKPRSLLAQSRGQDARVTASSRVHFFGYFLCASKESDSPARDGGRSPTGTNAAQARSVEKQSHWVPAFAGTTESKMDSALRRNDEREAFAGMTEREAFPE
jgi:hypothetical protein